MTRFPVSLWLALGAFGLSAAGCGHRDAGADPGETAPKPEPTVVIPKRAEYLEHAPCSQCHKHVEWEGGVSNPHSVLRIDHMPGGENCQTCHSRSNAEFLQLATGKLVSLDDAHLLCGQCHSQQTSDWETGIHGKQVGNWQGVMHRYACANCHDPHKPAFGSMRALPPPDFPEMGIPKEEH